MRSPTVAHLFVSKDPIRVVQVCPDKGQSCFKVPLENKTACRAFGCCLATTGKWVGGEREGYEIRVGDYMLEDSWGPTK